MDEPLQCPACGSQLPSGVTEDLCTKCLLQAGLETSAHTPLPTNTETLAPGTRVRYLGDYELLEEIGRGGMGVVYKARQDSLNRTVALKMILAGQLASEADIQRFRTEAEAAANLDHPGIVPIFEVGEFEGQHYFSMGFVDGCSLSERLASGPLVTREAAELTQKIAEALAYAHAQGVIHRDLKPSNIMLDSDGRPRVMDFGLAKHDAGEINMTIEGQVLGTPAYMSPEQAKGESHTTDARSDIYSLGVILYELLTGELPFRGTRAMLMVHILQDDPQPLRSLNNHIPRDLETICLKCLDRDSRKRYASGEELAQDLQRWLDGRPVLARPIARPERLWRCCKRNPAVASLSFSALLLMLVLTLVSTTAAVWINNARAAALVNERIAKEERANAEEERAKAESERAKAEVERAKGDIERRKAEVERAKAEDERVIASQAKVDASKRLVRMQTAKGETLVEKGDLSAALLWFARALKTSESAGVSQTVPRLRIAEQMNRLPKLIQVFDEPLDQFSNDGQYRLTLTRSLDDCSLTGLTQQEIDEANSRFVPQIAIWNTNTGEQVGETIELEHSPGQLNAFFSPDGRRFVTRSGEDLTARVWDTKTGQPVSPLMKLGNPITREEMPGHVEGAAAVASPYIPASLSRDGRYFSGEGQVWDVATGTQVMHLSGNPEPNCCNPVFSPDGTLVATFDENGDFRIRDIKTGKAISPTISGGITDLVFSPDGRHIATSDSYADERGFWIRDVQSGKVVVKGLPGSNITFSPDGKHIVTTNYPDIVRVWSASTGEPVSPELLHGRHENDARDALFEAAFDDFRFSDDGPGWNDIADELTALKEFQSSTEYSELPLPNNVNDVSFSPDGTFLVTASDVGSARVWNAITGHAVTLPLWHGGAVRQVRFSQDGNRVYTGGDDGVRVWQMPRPYPPITQAIPYHERFGDGPAFSADGRWVMLQSRESVWQLCDLVSGQQVELPDHPERSETKVGSVWLSGDGSVFATAPWSSNWDGSLRFDPSELRLWNAATGKPLMPPIEYVAGANIYSFSADAKKCLLVAGDPTVFLRLAWLQYLAPFFPSLTDPHLAVAAPLQIICAGSSKSISLEAPNGHFTNDAAFTPDGNKVVRVSWQEGIQLWDATTGKALSEPKTIGGGGGSFPGGGIAFSPDGKQFVASYGGEHTQVWDTDQFQPISNVITHKGSINHVVFSPDGTMVATAGADWMAGDGSARVWDATTGDPISPLLRHEESVELVSFSADSGLVITASHDETVGVWDVATGDRVIPPFPQKGYGGYASFTPDGRKVVTLETDQVVVRDLQTTQLPVQDLVNLAQVLAGGHLTDDIGTFSHFKADALKASLQKLQKKYPAVFRTVQSQVMAGD